ncbi:hypothetical protein CGRA01v4_04370 [Colletotrichum graminicola]|uniref:Uncharacterized protein n=1 Tax=Colletotrichum graminicola (strain M1.001 / M2 / FGSC 10212) TaxID=645133 RepID=E3Q9D1_COLGM|nr:uncharacterized protein GLRG_01805 [Colletotrichum graminicola M1.001]EFQ27310.1 hypothetical protein GLRG_01805 [Colletotrichum graminicola M1.001]WDK13089.1 hypothetical protein CGRA01v4_04370 [Colletotrichum graminicola]
MTVPTTGYKAYDALTLQHALNAGESAAALKKTVQELQRIMRGQIRDITRSTGEVANAAAKAEQARQLALQEELKAVEVRSDKAQNNAAQAMMVAEANNEKAVAFAARDPATAGSSNVNQQQQQNQQQNQPVASQGRRRHCRRPRDPNHIPKSGYTLHCIHCGVRRSRNDEVRRHLRKEHYPTLFPGLDRNALLAQARLDAP